MLRLLTEEQGSTPDDFPFSMDDGDTTLMLARSYYDSRYTLVSNENVECHVRLCADFLV
jgi:hypothetical protein